MALSIDSGQACVKHIMAVYALCAQQQASRFVRHWAYCRRPHHT